MSIRGLFLICCMVCTALGAAAQGRISGKVYDSHSGQPVEYATVAILKVSDSSLVTGTVTEPNGAFSTNVANGRYLVRISFMGYHTFFYPKQVTIGNNSNSVNLGKIEISPNSTVMDEVRVTAERTMVEYQLDKRVVNVDKNLVSSGGTATDVLEQVPSVAVDNDGNVTLRGSSNVKVLINGRPYEMMGNDLETLLEQIPASTVESVEVITNPSAKYDPEGMSGIINIKLKEKTVGALGLNGVANLNIGGPLPFLVPEQLPSIIPTTMGSLSLNYTTEKYNLFLTVDGGMRSRGSHGHSMIQRLRDSIPLSHDTIDQYGIRRNYMGSIKVGGEYYFNDKNSLLVSYQLRGGKRLRTSQIFTNDLMYNGLMDYTQLDTNNNLNFNHVFNLSYVKKFDEKDRELTADVTFSTRQVKGDGLQEQLYRDTLVNTPPLTGNPLWDNYYLRRTETENHHQSLNLKMNYVHPFAEVWKLETGYEGRMDWPDQDARYFRTEYHPTTHQLYNYFDSTTSTHFNYNQQTHGIYATVGGKFTDKLSAQGGLRLEYSYLNGVDLNHPSVEPIHKSYWELYPTLHLSYEINQNNSMQLSYSRRVRRPHMWDLNPYLDVREGQQMSFGNPNLDPEFTNAFELSYNLGINKWNIYTCAYYRQTNNMMTRYGFVWDSLSRDHYSPWMPYNPQYEGYWASTWQNLDKGYNYGLEFIVDWQVMKWWKLNLSINMYHSTIQGTQLLNNKSHSAWQASGKFTSYMTLPADWTIQFSGQYFAPWLDLQTTMLPSYWFDLAVKKDVLQKRGTINIRVGDVFSTGGWGHTTFTNQLSRVVNSRRISPTITVGFSYKINNGLKQRQQVEEDDDSGTENVY